jgi:hypothetical protein
MSRRQGRTQGETQMPVMDDFHSQILEGYWQGLCSYEIAAELGADPVIVARIIDDFNTLGF